MCLNGEPSRWGVPLGCPLNPRWTVCDDSPLKYDKGRIAAKKETPKCATPEIGTFLLVSVEGKFKTQPNSPNLEWGWAKAEVLAVVWTYVFSLVVCGSCGCVISLFVAQCWFVLVSCRAVILMSCWLLLVGFPAYVCTHIWQGMPSLPFVMRKDVSLQPVASPKGHLAKSNGQHSAPSKYSRRGITLL